VSGAAAVVIGFGDLFEGLGTSALSYRAAGDLHGRQVAITGFLVAAHDRLDRFLLVDTAGACPDCAPVPVAAVALPGVRHRPARLAADVAVTVEGRLSVGYQVDACGEASFLRLGDVSFVRRRAVGARPG
jgi:hypothetical protein